MINEMNPGQRPLKPLAGAAFIGMALCYITLFIIYGAILSTPANANTAEKIAYLIDNKGLFNVTYVLGYVLFACLLCFCVYVIGGLYQQVSQPAMAMATMFGYFWVVVLLCTGMIGITSHELLASYSPSNPAAADAVYYARALLTESLGGGIEFIGGVWLLLFGAVSWRHGLLSKALSAFTLIKGAIGIATLFSAEPVLRDLFGITGIVWFLWMGIAMIRKPS
ncbi:DUF4386 family protein [Saccharospirillum impatiens]|uniref:DUF4386 family protein n=1 Tax=Saccharospirillum impatiens TaxID=169438 RepID=UPI0004113E2F|nr:DUF4386 family protein [Saccharospirillum impatiens]